MFAATKVVEYRRILSRNSGELAAARRHGQLDDVMRKEPSPGGISFAHCSRALGDSIGYGKKSLNSPMPSA